ncbi:translocation/assembly module TamB domain-containing protein [Yunchengibacter salinarum]|uniref:translocation/assembly module TamB domain-containing protein n=1 Tax=Yunchengibacter salinarum TaxID=3133399 RepID=UPI0035B5E800
MTDRDPDPNAPHAPALRRARRVARALVLTLLGLVATLTVAGGAGLIWLDSGSGHRWLAAQIRREATPATPGIRLDGLSGSLFGTVRIEGLALTDRGGAFARVGRVHLGWRPWALTARTLRVTRLETEGATLTRLPAFPATGAENDGGGLSPLLAWLLPRSARIDGVDVPLDVSGLLAGAGRGAATIRLSAALQARARPLAVSRLSLSVAPGPTGDGRDRVSIVFDRVDRAAPLTLKAEGAVHPAGLVDRLAGLSLTAPVELDLSGAGPPHDWRGNVRLAGALARLDGDVAVAGRDVRLAGTLVPRPAAAERMADVARLYPALLRETAEFELAARLDDTPDLTATLTGAAHRLEAGATFGDWSSAPESARFALDLDGPDLGGALAGWQVRDVRLRAALTGGSLSGDLDGAPFTGSLSAARLGPDSGHLRDVAMDFALARQGGDLALRLNGSPGRPVGPDVPPPLSVSYRMTTTAYLDGWAAPDRAPVLHVADLTVTGGPVAFSAEGRGDSDHGLHQLDGRLDLALAPFAGGLLPVDSRGRMQLLATTRENRDGVVRLTLSGDGLALGPLADQVLGAAPRMTARLMTDQPGFGLSEIAVQTRAVSLTGDVRMAADRALSGYLALRLLPEELTLPGLPLALEGSVRMTADLSGQLDRPGLSLESRLDGLTLPLGTLTGVRLTATLPDLTRPEGPIRLTGELETIPLRASARLTRLDGAVRITEIAAAVDRLRLSGAMTVAPTLSGALTLSLDGQPTGRYPVLSGSGALTATLEQPHGHTVIGLEGNLVGLDTNLGVGAGLDRFEADARLSLEAPYPRLEGSLVATGLRRGLLRFERLAVGLAGADQPDSAVSSPPGTALTAISLSGAYLAPFDGQARLSVDGPDLALALAGRYGDTRIATETPIRLAPGGDGPRLNVPGLRVGTGRVEGAGARDAVRLKVERLPMAFLSALTGAVSATGNLSATLDMTLPDASPPTGRASLRAEALEFPALGAVAATSPPFDVAVRLTAEDGRATLVADVGAGDAPALETGPGFGRVKLDWPMGPTGLPSAGPVSGNVRWDGPVAPLWAPVRRPDHDLAGTLKAEMTLAGTVAAPALEGSAVFQGGRYGYRPLGLALEGLTARLEGRGALPSGAETADQTPALRLRLTDLSAEDGRGGTLGGEGTLMLDSKLVPSMSMRFVADSLRVLDTGATRAVASADLSYERDAGRSRLSGSLTAEQVDATLANRFEGDVAALEVREINRPGESADPRQPRFVDRHRTDLSLDVSVPNRFFVHGRGLESEWQGALEVRGTTDQPRITGSLSALRGTFDFAGTRFELERGVLGFDGGQRIDPTLDMMTRASLTGLDVTLSLNGHVSAPRLDVASSPALPQDEVLARLLFGRDAASLSAVQLAQLAATLQQLQSGGGGLMGNVRSTLGLDRLNARGGEGEDGGVVLTGGKYIRNNVYLEVESNTATQETATRVQVDLTRRLRAETEIGPDNRNSLKLRWVWDY